MGAGGSIKNEQKQKRIETSWRSQRVAAESLPGWAALARADAGVSSPQGPFTPDKMGKKPVPDSCRANKM